MSILRVSEVSLVLGSDSDRAAGLLGFVSLVLNDSLRLDGLTLRRTNEGETQISFPSRRNRMGREFPYIRPLSEQVRVGLQLQVLRALREAGEEIRD